MGQHPEQLRKILGRRDVLALAFGAMIGWGWVVLAGDLIDQAGTIGSMLAFAVGAIMILLVGLTYAELTSALPRAGGELAFTFAGLGPTASYICGWTLVLAYLSVCAFEAVALPTVFGYMFPGFQFGHLYTLGGWDVYATWVLVGMLGALAIGVINYLGIQPASVLQWTAALVMLVIGITFFIGGTITGEAANLVPHFTSVGGFLAVVMMTPFLFIGFDVIPQVAEEINVPFALIGKLLVSSILIALGWYVAVQWTVGFALSPAAHSAGELPTADAMAAVFRSAWAGRVLVFAGLLGIVTSWNAFFLGATRVLFAMARGGMLPRVFGQLDARRESPVAAIILLTALSMVAPLLGRPALVFFVNAGSLAAVVAYLLVTISFLRLQRIAPDLPRPYRVPAPRAVGVLALVATLLFILLYLPGSPSALGRNEWLIVAGWVLLGVVFSIGIPRRVRLLGRAEQERQVLGGHVPGLTAKVANPMADVPAPAGIGSRAK